uniref:Putative lipocalin n=1 Tax=Rhipicephalus microplus TaxID=6941 RepID=A0A6G5A2T2_RHIMP
MKYFQIIVIAVLPTAILATAEDVAAESSSEQTQQENEKQQQELDVDIAEFYANGSFIWILGETSSQYPCRLDVVGNTNEDTTYFTRYHWQSKKFPGKNLVGKFTNRGTDRITYNAMFVSPAGRNGKRIE